MEPAAFARQLAWLMPFAVIFTYLALMLVVARPDVTLQSYTTMYIDTVWHSLVPMLGIAIGAWLLYSYVYGLTVPVLRSMGRGGGAHHVVGLAGSILLRILTRVVQTWASIRGIIERDLTAYLSLSLQRILRMDVPVHLAIGWRPGTHPQVLYETSTR